MAIKADHHMYHLPTNVKILEIVSGPVLRGRKEADGSLAGIQIPLNLFDPISSHLKLPVTFTATLMNTETATFKLTTDQNGKLSITRQNS